MPNLTNFYKMLELFFLDTIRKNNVKNQYGNLEFKRKELPIVPSKNLLIEIVFHFTNEVIQQYTNKILPIYLFLFVFILCIIDFLYRDGPHGFHWTAEIYRILKFKQKLLYIFNCFFFFLSFSSILNDAVCKSINQILK